MKREKLTTQTVCGIAKRKGYKLAKSTGRLKDRDYSGITVSKYSRVCVFVSCSELETLQAFVTDLQAEGLVVFLPGRNRTQGAPSLDDLKAGIVNVVRPYDDM